MNRTHLLAIGKGAVLEMLRRRDLAVLGLFMGVYLTFLAAARFVGIETPAAGTFLLNLSLTLVVLLCQLLTLLMAARQLPDELERRTLFPLMARPVSRTEILVAKGLAAWVTGVAVFAVLLVPTMLLVPKMETYYASTLLQTLLLQPVALAVTASVALCFSILFPRVLAVFLSGLIVFAAGLLVRLPLLSALSQWVPDPGRLNLVVRYTDGIGPLPAGEWMSLTLSGLLWSVLFLAAACRIFQQRSV
jgi:ABC-type transport system involved in multi-copper enzyme maturation permease subunit